MDKQKDEIVRSDRLAQEIRQEVYILQREVIIHIYVYVEITQFLAGIK